jgi:hypothetical protein
MLSPLLWQDAAQAQQARASVLRGSRHDVSRPLRDITPVTAGRLDDLELEPAPRPTEPAPPAPGVPDSVVQTSPVRVLGTIDLMNFEGVEHTGSAPPDTNGAIGPTQYMQWANSKLAIFDKSTGEVVYGPVSGSTLFSGMGLPCETNHGDGIILYDKIDGRWFFSQLLNNSPEAPTTVCIALSATSDATDVYYRYAFDLSNVLPPGTTLSDYPKFGVWPDGYYYTANIFGATSGVNLCAFDRGNMLVGNDATAQCFFSRTIGGSYLPADLDGSTPPPDGSPNFLLDLSGTGAVRLVKFHVDFAVPDNSTLSAPITIPVAPFTRPSGGVPQLGSTQTLATLGDRLMFRLAYRNFGDHESLVANHSVAASGSIGVRWYELRGPNDDVPVVYQQGTYMPDDVFRWMGSIAMDGAGDVAVGYSASSSDIHPAIRYTGRTPDDPLGALEDEHSILEGGGSQQPTLSRWGDYSSITIDPVDDCTFWFTTEYHQADGGFNWNTRIASFSFPSCGMGPLPVTGLSSRRGAPLPAVSPRWRLLTLPEIR